MKSSPLRLSSPGRYNRRSNIIWSLVKSKVSIDQVISIELQKNNYRDMIRANPKWKYAGTYVDDGFSGTNTEHRPAFSLMMKDAMAGKIDMIIAKSVSRFACNLLDCIGWVRRLKKNEPSIPPDYIL